MRKLVLAFRSLFLHRRREREMQEEMSQHLELATERLLARGMSPEEARRAATARLTLRDAGEVRVSRRRTSEIRRWLEHPRCEDRLTRSRRPGGLPGLGLL